MTRPSITVYTPDSSLTSPAVMVRDMLRDLYAGRQLAWRLALRDIRAQYRQAFLGILWAFIMPLANTVTWIFLNTAGIISVGSTDIPYPLYVFTGTMLWAVLIDSINAPMAQTNAARAMLAKLNFPREALIVSGIYQTLFNTAIKIGLALVAVVFMGINPGWGLLLFPLGILSLLLVGTAIGLLITPVGMLYTDIGRGLQLLMQFLMYLTPVVFPMPKEGWAALLFQLNPLTPVVVTAREWLTGAEPTMLMQFAAVNAAAALLLIVVWIAYRLAMPILIERISA
jgi:lipopolysaccharide transport system permease protein